MEFDLSKSMGKKEVRQIVNSFYQEFMRKGKYTALKEVTHPPGDYTI